ncbi:acyltransferase family protein [Actinoplanes derwentensis]|uniref:Acyltransferase family protein n=1 Tax=Actinoplanes derwentensis TaxID=113562 RepID=A0A1H2BNF3_9ACTN|nr:acyltransferase family protein [Actinoplanes derwentensis]GID86911.1 membrane protein [Actinoplanes derwentensis]SDT59870.1 Acyltransferase family protein [Actinoplanes derwentensis]
MRDQNIIGRAAVVPRQSGPRAAVSTIYRSAAASPSGESPRPDQHHHHGRLGRIRGLDGIRALSVAAVLAYHVGTAGGPTVLPGGFLGVDVFFVVSGFLITSLLFGEAAKHGRISLRQFYIRRARRLLPASYLLLITVALLGPTLVPDQVQRLKGDIVAAVAYGTNWWLLHQNGSYFATDSEKAPLLNHLWSLAVEEQFYLIWPLFVILLWRTRWTLLGVTLALITGSTLLATYLYNPFTDPSRVYFGTDTRAAAPLVGAALAIALRPWLWGQTDSPARGRAINLTAAAGVTAVVTLIALMRDDADFLYQGGFLLVAIAAGALVVGVSHPSSRLGAALDARPLRWLGERSYGIYLWHWPIFVLLPAGGGITGWCWAVVKIGISIAVAALSYRLVEQPIRHGLPKDFSQRDQASRRAVRLRIAASVLIPLLAAGVAVVRLNDAPPPADPLVDAGPALQLGILPSAQPSKDTATPALTFKAPIRVAVFGDSQGMTLLRNTPDDLDRYLRITDETIEGCGIMLTRIRSKSGERTDLADSCPNWQEHWAESARKRRPQIALVMLGAWDVFDAITDTGTIAFGSPEWDALFMDATSRGIGELRAVGAQVALSLLPCYRPVRGSAGFWPERGKDVRTQHVNTLLTELAKRDPDRVFTINPPEEFCTDPQISTKLNYRWDGVHYYKAGAQLYFRTVVPQLSRVPRPAPIPN